METATATIPVYTLPTDSAAWKYLQDPKASALSGRIEELAQKTFSTLKRVSDEARDRGIQRLEIDEWYSVTTEGDNAFLCRVQLALCQRVADLAIDLGYYSSIDATYDTHYEWSPSTDPNDLCYPLGAGKQVEVADAEPNPTAFLMKLEDIGEETEQGTASIAAAVARCRKQIDAVVNRLEATGGPFACVTLYSWNLDVPRGFSRGNVVAPARELQARVWAQLLKSLGATWRERGDIAWKDDSRWTLTIAYMPQGTTSAMRDNLEEGKFKGYQAMPRAHEKVPASCC